MLRSFKIRVFDEDTGYGLLRHVLFAAASQSGEILVVLVTASPVFPSKNNFVKTLREKHPEITTIVQNINGRSTSMVLGDKEHVLYGKGYIEDVLCGLRFRISSRSFYQINSAQTEKLYGKAMELAGLTGKETVLDAYCGIGTIGLIASKHAGKVIGVELNQDAVRDAVQNAKKMASPMHSSSAMMQAGSCLIWQPEARVQMWYLWTRREAEVPRNLSTRSPDAAETCRLHFLWSGYIGQRFENVCKARI